MTPPEPSFPALLQAFFQRRLIAERGVSTHTIASYRDTFELFFHYLEIHTRRAPCTLTLEDLDAPTVLAFLDYLEDERGNSPRSRNLRLTAIRSFWRYAAVRDPTSLPLAQRVLAIPTKRFDRPALDFLSRQRRHYCHRHVARSRGDDHHPPVRRGRPHDEGGCAQATRGSASSSTHPIQGEQEPTLLPRRPLTMRTMNRREHPRTRAPPAQLPIVPTSS